MNPDGAGRRPGLAKASAASLASMGLVALGPKKPNQARQGNATSARELFGAAEPRAVGQAASSTSGAYRRPGLTTASASSVPSSSAAVQRPQAAKPVPVIKQPRPDTVPLRPIASHPFQRAIPSTAKADQTRKGDIKEWLRIAVDTDGKSLSSVLKMVATGDSSMGETQIAPLICGAVKQLVQNRHKEIDDILVMALSRLAALKPEYFRSEVVRSALLALVKKEQLGTVANLKGKISAVNCMIGANLLYAVYQNIPRWPLEIMKLYLEDAAMDRQWVDLIECREFVRAIRVSFATRAASVQNTTSLSQMESAAGEADSLRRPGISEGVRTLLVDEADVYARQSTSPGFLLSAGAPSPSTLAGDDSMSDSNFSGAASLREARLPRPDRFEQFQSELPDLIMDAIREATKRGNDGGKQLARFIISTAGVPAARTFGMQKIDTWLQNAKTANTAMTLMATICANCNGVTEDDLAIISMFLRIRLKSKTQTEIYFGCLNELLERNSGNLKTVLRMTFESELNDIVLGKRNPWTLTVMTAAFKWRPIEASHILAILYADSVMTHMDDTSRSLKLILHDLAKLQKAEIRLDRFVGSFLAAKVFGSQTDNKRMRGEDQTTRDKKLLTVIDLILAAEVLMMITRYKEEMVLGNPDPFISALAPLQESTISFLRKVHGPALFNITPDALRAAFRKIFFLDKPTLFQIMDKWPTEHERTLFFKVAARVPVTSNVLWQLRVQMSGCDTMMLVEMLELLLVRALGLRAEEHDVLKLGDLKFDFVDTLLDLGVYRPGDTVNFPPKYRPPTLVRKEIYWQAWKLVILLAAAEPSIFGRFAWYNMPTAKSIMQMLIINRFSFPPETILTLDKDVKYYLDAEQKLVEEERKATIEYENRLAGGTAKTLVITESNAKMLKDYMRFDPKGYFRQPPETFLKIIEGLGRSLELGKVFSGCRDPDFLLEILNEKGTAASLPWLLEITSSSKSMFDVLPVECVCEMLSNSLLKTPTGSSEKKDQDFQKCRNLAIRLSDSVRGDGSDVANVLKTLDFFCNGLRAATSIEREIARSGLEIVFDPSHIESALSALWGTEPAGHAVAPADIRPEVLPKSKHGISIEHLLERSRANAWCPDFINPRPVKSVFYAEKFSWLLVDIPARSPHFPELKDNMCRQLAKALEVESDVLTVCAYLEFLATYIKSSRCRQPDIPVYYFVGQRMADILVNRRDLRDAIFLGRDGILAKEDVHRIRKIIMNFFNTFLLSSVEITPSDFEGSAGQGMEPLIKSNCKIDDLGRTACLTATIARALLILLAVCHGSGHLEDRNVWSYCLDRTATSNAKEWLSGKSVSIMTPGVRETILRHSGDDRLVDVALHEISVDLLVEQVCCDNIPLQNLRQMIDRLDMNDANIVAKLKYVIKKHTLVARTLLECRLASGLSLQEPIQRVVKSTLDSLTNVFAIPFTA